MAPSEDVLARSSNLYAIEHGWPRTAAAGTPLKCLAGAAAAIDMSRRSAGERQIHGLYWDADTTPIGQLYREVHVKGLIASMRVFAEKVGASPTTASLLSALERAQVACTPLIRPYQYVEEALQDVVTVISARKIFGVNETELEEGSRVSLPDVSALWSFGESTGRITGCLPSRAEILWRPRRLAADDIEQLLRWTGSAPRPAAEAALEQVLFFFETARREQSEVELDGFCTDSPEAL